MFKSYYHASPYENLSSIMKKGILAGVDGLVYLADSHQDAADFAATRLCKNIVVLRVELEEDLVEEFFNYNEPFLSSNNSESFLDCKIYTYRGDINPNSISDIYRYKL